jgi:hypothetical protein
VSATSVQPERDAIFLDPSIFVGHLADENTVACPVFLSASKRMKISIINFIGYTGRRKYVRSFSSACVANENTTIIFVGLSSRRKQFYFRRLPTKLRLFSSILFCRSNFIGWPMKIAIFDSFKAIFDSFWPMKLRYFPVVRWHAAATLQCSGHQGLCSLRVLPSLLGCDFLEWGLLVFYRLPTEGYAQGGKFR